MFALEMIEKLSILADAAKYDVSCASSGSTRKGKGGVGNVTQGGICHSFAADGRCISLLKVLLTNVCVYDCAYCRNRRGNDVPRAAFTPRELADLTLSFYRRNYIEGLFLSSGVADSPDATMERMVEALRLLREEGRFEGYIHAKAIPGASPMLLERMGELCDRISVNIELPSSHSLRLLAPDKSREAILEPMGYLAARVSQTRFDPGPKPFAPAGQSTQMIVGATGDSDRRILQLAQGLYRRYRMRRVYYSAYTPVNHGTHLPELPRPPLLREHRLYQSDFLIRLYGFSAEELLPDAFPQLDPQLDPKAMWALRNLQHFPIEVNRADLSQLLRVPGIGTVSAPRIVQARRVSTLRVDDLAKLGVVMKRARHFITADGRYAGIRLAEAPVRAALVSTDPTPRDLFMEQLTFLPPATTDWDMLRQALPPAPPADDQGPPLLDASAPGAR